MADRLTSKTPMCVDESDEIGVKGDVAEFPDSDMQPMVFADLGDRIGLQVQSSPTQVLRSKEQAAVGRGDSRRRQFAEPAGLGIENYRVYGIRRLWKPPSWE
jgi:hypothetical protein